MNVVPRLSTIGAIGEGTIGLSERALSDYRSYRSTIGVLSESTIGTIGPLSGCEGARTPSDTIGAIGRAIGAISELTIGYVEIMRKSPWPMEVEHNHTQI